MKRSVYILAAARTAIGTFGGTLKDVSPADLATTAVVAALGRSSVKPEEVGHVVFGNVMPSCPQDAYLSRVAAIRAGIPYSTPAFNVNRLCGSGVQAIISASLQIQSGDVEVAVAGGAESMSKSAYLLPSVRWGARMGDVGAIDFMLGVLHDPLSNIHMGETAENIAHMFDITRQQQDEYALESQRRAANAIAKGYFKEQIVPITLKAKKGEVVFDTDEGVRPGSTMEQLAAMRPAFRRDGGTVTAGNASTLNDGAAAVVLASEDWVRKQGASPLARIVSFAHSGVDPQIMGVGPVSASRLALERAGIGIEALDLIESNDAFAAQACAVAKLLELPADKVNPNGSGLSLGHPISATGAILVTKAVYELARIEGRYALVTMCIGGGQGIAMVLEREPR
ncbi:acetyl-CoA acetyltransferase [Aquabacterium sp. NJ1]|uniref:beta-ketothiolase BktB n=1 Tax=Aquabacterium sp. NJ1 TaxID=1538295 RepID=UPI00052B9E4A|nr:beta-ketothiolase BktB [Aquabacterium sp. NJ1]KGM41955.1 acetyl-CoA acetyltransferase [Aquabacterium sp. NJ1]